MGVDLSVGTVESISSLPGGKYGSVATTAEFEQSVGGEFCHDVVPIMYDLRLHIGGGWAIERACGSAELNALGPDATEIHVSSEFATPLDADCQARGGVVLLKLKPPTAA